MRLYRFHCDWCGLVWFEPAEQFDNRVDEDFHGSCCVYCDNPAYNPDEMILVEIKFRKEMQPICE